MSEQQGSYLDWFRYRTVPKIPGLFESTFWDQVVLQASVSEPAVLHASLALAAAHRDFRFEPFRSHQVADYDESSFILQHYNKAIVHARGLLANGDRPSIRLSLVLCLLFTCLEYMRGHYGVGNAHLSGGLELMLCTKNSLGEKHDYIDVCVSEEFARLNVQSLSFGQRAWAQTGMLVTKDRTVMSSRFSSMAEARNSLLQLLNKCCGLYAQSYLHTTSDSRSSLHVLKIALESDLAGWLTIFESSQVAVETQLGAAGPVAYRMLLLYHTYATLALAPCLDPTGEMAFDGYLNTFVSILDQTRELRQLVFSGIFTGTAHELREDAAPFVVDMAGIAPLYYTAVKCRDRHVRMQAVEMLEDTKKREGVWDSDVAACVAREIIRIEEASWPCRPTSGWQSNLNDESSCGSTGFREHRLCDARVTLPNEPTGDIVLTCSWEKSAYRPPIKRTYNQRRRMWSGVES